MPLGRFEHLALLATLHLGDGAYAVSVSDEIARRTGARPVRGALYTTLARLEAKGLLASTMGEPMAIRGGKARRYYCLTPAGTAALAQARAELIAAWPRATRLLGDLR